METTSRSRKLSLLGDSDEIVLKTRIGKVNGEGEWDEH